MEFGSWNTRLAELIGYFFPCLVICNLVSCFDFKRPFSSYNLSCLTILYFRTESSLLSWDGWLGEGWDYTLYRKRPIINPGLIFVQKAFLLGLFSGDLIFGGAYY